MKITILGSGTSIGVPTIGCSCVVCKSTDPRDRRLRCSSMIEHGDTRILMDCGPDFREQMLRVPFRRINGIFITHEHYDHVGGIDDLRPFCVFGDVDIYAEDYAATHLEEQIPYCFVPKEKRYPGVPALNLIRIKPHDHITVGELTVEPIRVMHGRLPILGYRIGTLAYITDMSTIDESEIPYLEGIDTLIVNALRPYHHPSHQTIDSAIEFSRRLGARETYLIHMSHHILPHAQAESQLPPHFHFAYDGLEIEVTTTASSATQKLKVAIRKKVKSEE